MSNYSDNNDRRYFHNICTKSLATIINKKKQQHISFMQKQHSRGKKKQSRGKKKFPPVDIVDKSPKCILKFYGYKENHASISIFCIIPDFLRISYFWGFLAKNGQGLSVMRSRWCWPFADQRCYGAGKRRGVVSRGMIYDFGDQVGRHSAPGSFSSSATSPTLPLSARWLAMSMRFQLAYLRNRRKTNFTSFPRTKLQFQCNALSFFVFCATYNSSWSDRQLTSKFVSCNGGKTAVSPIIFTIRLAVNYFTRHTDLFRKYLCAQTKKEKITIVCNIDCAIEQSVALMFA